MNEANICLNASIHSRYLKVICSYCLGATLVLLSGKIVAISRRKMKK